MGDPEDFNSDIKPYVFLSRRRKNLNFETWINDFTYALTASNILIVV